MVHYTRSSCEAVAQKVAHAMRRTIRIVRDDDLHVLCRQIFRLCETQSCLGVPYQHLYSTSRVGGLFCALHVFRVLLTYVQDQNRTVYPRIESLLSNNVRNRHALLDAEAYFLEWKS